MSGLFELSSEGMRLAVDGLGRVSWLGLDGEAYIGAARGPLCELTMQEDPTPSTRGVRHYVTNESSKPNVQEIPDGYRLVYDELIGEKHTWKVRLVLDVVLKDKAFVFTVQLQNGETGWQVREIRYPILPGIEVKHNRLSLLWPQHAGRRMNDLDDLGFKQLLYPGPASMQWFALVAPDRGLYIASHDRSLQATALQARVEPSSGEMECALAKYPICREGSVDLGTGRRDGLSRKLA